MPDNSLTSRQKKNASQRAANQRNVNQRNSNQRNRNNRNSNQRNRKQKSINNRNITQQKRIRKNRKQQKQQIVYKRLLCLFVAIAVVLAVVIIKKLSHSREKIPAEDGLQQSQGQIPRPELDVELLTVNEYSRPAIALDTVKGIVIHYTANPGTGAMANRNYFEGLKDSHVTKASSHFIIGLDGEIVQCIPSSEISYASNQRNDDTLSIECCIEDDTGRFNQKTYESMVHLTAWLMEHFGLKKSDVIRHYDVTGKVCPKYFVDFPEAWEQFLSDVQEYAASYGVSW